MKKPPTFTVTKVQVAQVKYYETFHTIKDEHGNLIFTGDEATAARILRLLKADKRKARK